jgi:glycosyltransferase involved in cell wall biosynthesis
MGSQNHTHSISVVVPARNEEATIWQVVERSFRAFAELGREGEVLVVNDGSSDGTGAVLADLQRIYPRLRVFSQRRSQGMTAGLQQMFGASRGDIVILIPADMESDPLQDVPVLVRHLEQHNLDIVAGWRQGRNDGKVLASKVYNVVMRWLANVPVHDGNWIKAMRRSVIESFPPLRSDWHRFLLMIAAQQGFRMGEVPTYYKPRTAGSSKFGWQRIPISLLDVLVLKFLLAFSHKPMRFFGGIGLMGIVLSLLTFLYLTGLYLFTDTQQRPIFLAAGILAIISVLLLLVGFLAELIVSQGERISQLERRLIELDDKGE